MLCVLAVLLAAQVQAQEKKAIAEMTSVLELRTIAQQAMQAKNYPAFGEAMQRLTELRPHNSEYMYGLVLAYALQDIKNGAYAIMLKMQRQGLSYDFDQASEAESIRGTQLYEYLNDLMVKAGAPVGNATLVVSLGQEITRPEAMAWDPTRQKFIIGTVDEGLILAVSKDGPTEQLLKADDHNGFWGIYGLAVDANRNRLWASSAARPEFNRFDRIDKGLSVLLEIDLKSMKVIKKYPVPFDGRPHNLGSVVVASNGDVFVLDSVFPVVYKKRAIESALKPYFAAKDLVSLRDLDISPDGKRLYLADYEMGIVIIELASGKIAQLRAPEILNLGGIRSVNLWQDRLIMVQSGIKPQRIMSVELDETGLEVVSISPVAVALDLMDFPGKGVVIDHELYFFANSHWYPDENLFRPVTIASTNLEHLPSIISPDVESLLDRQKQGGTRTVTMPESAESPGEK